MIQQPHSCGYAQWTESRHYKGDLYTVFTIALLATAKCRSDQVALKLM